MGHSYSKIWIHAVFSTKDREGLIKPGIENKIYQHIREQFIEMGCAVRIINGMPDHVHILFLLNRQKSITDVIKQVKGNTSHWINAQSFSKELFLWQTGYGAFSVSESQLEKIHNYIFNQKHHHHKKSSAQEYDEFIFAHGLQKGSGSYHGDP